MLALVAALLHGHQAKAQDIDPSTIDATVGTWLVAPADGQPGCRLRLSREGAIGGFALDGAEDGCKGKVPQLVDAAAWNFGENAEIIFIDPLRKVLAHFEEVEGSPYRSIEEPRLLLLHEPPAGLDSVPTEKLVAGDWVLKRPKGEKLCDLTLKAEAADSDSYPLSPSGDCAKAVKKLKLFRYQLNGFSLSLLGEDGSAILMEETEPGHFEKSREEGGKPLVMERKG